MQRKHNLKLNYNSMSFDKIEINLVGFYGIQKKMLNKLVLSWAKLRTETIHKGQEEL